MLLCTATINAKKPLLPAPTPSAQDQFASHEFSADAFSHIPSDAQKDVAINTISQDDQEDTALTPEVSVDDKKADLDFCIQVVNDMGTEGFNPDALSPSGVTALQLLTFYYMHGITDADQAIEELLKNKATVNIQGPILKTPLFFITAYTALTNQAAQQALISNDIQDENAEVVMAQPQQTTTLMFQNAHSREKNLTLLDLLLSYGANPFTPDENENTPFDIAIQLQDMDILNLFAKYEWITIIDATEDVITSDDDLTA